MPKTRKLLLVLILGILALCGPGSALAREPNELHQIENEIHEAMNKMAVGLNPYVEKEQEQPVDAIMKAEFLYEFSFGLGDLVMSYLGASGTKYQMDEADDYDFALIEPREQGAWLNQIAHRLKQEGLEFAIAPQLLEQQLLGVCADSPRRVTLAVPPFPGSTAEILAHEIYHDLVIAKTKQEHVCHIQQGSVERSRKKDRSWSRFYQNFDMSEVGAYAESVYQLGKGVKTNPKFKDSLFHDYSMKRATKYLVELSASIHKALASLSWMAWGVQNPEIILTKEEGHSSLELAIKAPMGTKLRFRNFLEIKEVANSQIRWGVIEGNTYGIFVEFGKYERRLISRRLNLLRSIYSDLNEKFRRFKALPLEEQFRASEEPRNWVREANREWLRHRGVAETDGAFQFEEKFEELLNCAELLR